MDEKTIKVENRSYVITFRVIQSLFLGIFALGISSSLGDFFVTIKMPLSNFSITTTVFGLVGAIISGIFAKRSEKW